jgi:hypothetical protein
MGIKRLLALAFLLLTVFASFMAGCGKQVETATTSPDGTEPSAGELTWDEVELRIANGKALAEGIIELIPQNQTWLSPVPLVGGERVHILTDEEKNRVLQIAMSFAPVLEAQGHTGVLSVDERDCFWKSYSNGEAVDVSNAYIEKCSISQELDEYMGDKCYPGVFLLFRTECENYAYAGMYITVNLEQEEVIYVDGFIEVICLPSGYESSGMNPESFTLCGMNTLSPLHPDYDPSGIWDCGGTRFGPPWDNSDTVPGE